jgi:excisionase family DNA binding protein
MTVEKLAYRPEEAAEASGLGRSTIFNLLRSGELESLKVGRARLIPVDALRKFIKERAA